MKYSLILVAVAALGLSACQKPAETPAVPPATVIEVPVAVPGPAGEPGKPGAEGMPGATGAAGTAGTAADPTANGARASRFNSTAIAVVCLAAMGAPVGRVSA